MLATVVKQTVDLPASYLTELYNHSLADVHFPSARKQALITSIVKNLGVDAADVSQLVPAYLLERLVASQVMEYMSTN